MCTPIPLDAFDTILHICGYMEVEDLLNNLQLVNKLWQSVIAQLLKQIRQSPDYHYLTFKSHETFRTDHQILGRISTNRKNAEGGFILAGGSFHSYDTNSYWIRDSTVRFEGHRLRGLDHLRTIGSSPMLLDRYGCVRSYGGWNETTEPEPECVNTCYLSTPVKEWPGAPSRRRSTTMDANSTPMAFATSHRLPEPRCFSAATTSVDGQRVYVLGGCSSPYRGAQIYASCLSRPVEDSNKSLREIIERIAFSFSHEYYYDVDIEDLDSEDPYWYDDSHPLLTGAWNEYTIAPMLTPRGGHCAITLPDDSLFVLGGYGGDLNYHSSTELWIPERGSWLPGPSMHVPRSGAAAAYLGYHTIYVAGGSRDGTHSHKTIERCDLRQCTSAGQWEMLRGEMHCPRGYVTGAVGASGAFFVCGGLHDGYLQGGLEAYEPRMDRWILVPGSCDVTRIPESSTAHFAIYPTTTASTSSVEDTDAVAAANEASSASFCRGMIPTIHREALLRAGHQLMYAL